MRPYADSERLAALVRKNGELHRERRRVESSAYWAALCNVVFRTIRFLERYGQTATPAAVCHELGMRADVLEKVMVRDTRIRRRMREELGYRSRCRSAALMLRMERKRISVVAILRMAKLSKAEKRLFKKDTPLRRELGILPKCSPRVRVRYPTVSDLALLQANK